MPITSSAPVPIPIQTPTPQVPTTSSAPVPIPIQTPTPQVPTTSSAPVPVPIQTPTPQVPTSAPPVPQSNQPEPGIRTVGETVSAADDSRQTALSSPLGPDNLLPYWGAAAAAALGAIGLAGAAFVRRGNGALVGAGGTGVQAPIAALAAATSPNLGAVGNMTQGDPGGTAQGGTMLASPDHQEVPLPHGPSQSDLDHQAESGANQDVGRAQQAVDDADPDVPVKKQKVKDAIKELRKANSKEFQDAFNSVSGWNAIDVIRVFGYSNDVFGLASSGAGTAEDNLIASYVKSINAHRGLDNALESLFLVTRLEFQPTLSPDTGDLYDKLDSIENQIKQAEKDFNSDVDRVKAARRALGAELLRFNDAMNYIANLSWVSENDKQYADSAKANLEKKIRALEDAEKAVDDDYNHIIELYKEKDEVYKELIDENRQNKTQN